MEEPILNSEVNPSEYHVEEKNAQGEIWVRHHTLRPDDLELDPPQRLTTSDILFSLESESEKPFYHLSNLSLEKGDLKNSILTFLTASVGAGLLSFPKIFACFGVFFGIIYTFFFAWFNYLTYAIIDKAVIISGKKGYGNICAFFLGKKAAKIASVGIMAVLLVVSCVYATISWVILEQLLVNYGIVDLPVKDPKKNTYDEYAGKTYLVRLISMAAVAALCFPMMLFRKLAVLRYVTASIIVVLMYIVMLGIIQAPSFTAHNRQSPHYDVSLWKQTFDSEWVSSIGALSMSFSCQPIYMYIRAGIKAKQPKRTFKVYAWGLWVEIFMYAGFGMAGYYSLGGEMVPDMFTQRHPINPDDKDLAMKVAQIALFPLLVLHVLLPFITLRESIIQYYNLSESKKTFFSLSLGLCLFIFALPVVYPDVFSLIGIFGGLFSGFFSSGIFFVIGFRITQSKVWKGIYVTMVVIITAAAFANTYVSINTIISQ